MKKLSLIALVCLAAGCGSQTGATSTVTAPARTVTKTSTDQAQVVACRVAISYIIRSSKQLLSATGIYEAQIKPAYVAGASGGSVDQITSKIREGTAHVHQGTALLKRANSFATQCAK